MAAVVDHQGVAMGLVGVGGEQWQQLSKLIGRLGQQLVDQSEQQRKESFVMHHQQQIPSRDADPTPQPGVRNRFRKLNKSSSDAGKAVSDKGRARFRKPQPMLAAAARALVTHFESALGDQVAMALRLIGSGHCPPVLQLARGGYDAHAQQAARHGRSFTELGAALAEFAAGLERLTQRAAVQLLAVREFGWRLQENGSRGTNHGSASVTLLGDGRLEPLMGRYPSPRELDGQGH